MPGCLKKISEKIHYDKYGTTFVPHQPTCTQMVVLRLYDKLFFIFPPLSDINQLISQFS